MEFSSIAVNNMTCKSSTSTTYQHNPYAFNALYDDDNNVALKSCFELYDTDNCATYNIVADGSKNLNSAITKSASIITRTEKVINSEPQCLEEFTGDANNVRKEDGVGRLDKTSAVRDSGDFSFDVADEGVSEASSEHGCTQQRESTFMMTMGSCEGSSMYADNLDSAHNMCEVIPNTDNYYGLSNSNTASLTTPFLQSSLVGVANDMKVPIMPIKLPCTTFRYASVNFRFGSAWFVAPFRTFIGDMVVVQYPGNNNSLHMGLVSAITTEKPLTFYSDANTDPNHLTEAELRVLPTILRHARDFDKETKLDLRSHDLRALANAQLLALEMKAPVSFIDAEWLLDLSAVTFLVHVFGDVALVDRLADELAAQEGAEVVFTFPAANNTS